MRLKKGKFKWEEKQEANFALLMEKLSIALILALLNFSKVLEDECDALSKVIGVVLFKRNDQLSTCVRS